MQVADDEQLLTLPFHILLPQTSENTTHVSICFLLTHKSYSLFLQRYLLMSVMLDKLSADRLQLHIAYKQLKSPSDDQQPTHPERPYAPPCPGLTVFMPNCPLSSPIFIVIHSIRDCVLDVSTASSLTCPITHLSQDKILLAITIQERCRDIPVTLDITGNIALINTMNVFTSHPHALGDTHVDYTYARAHLQNLLGGDDVQWPNV